MRLAVVASHPIQYQAPLFRELAKRLDLTVFFGHRATAADQSAAGFGVPFEWDVDLVSGYDHAYLRNVAPTPGIDHFYGCDTPEVGEVLSKGDFDAVLLTGWHLKCFLQALWAAKRAAVPVLVRGDSQVETARPAWKRAVKGAVYPAFLRMFDSALYVGQRSRDYWLHYRYPRARLYFSPHCVDNEWFAARATPAARHELRGRLGIGEGTKIVLFAGKLVPFKRPLDLVEAVSRLGGYGVCVSLLVAGSGPLATEMTEMATRMGVELSHLGFCNQTQMPCAYAAADVLVLPSDSRETWGLVANEALACGVPIVLSNAVGAAPDLGFDESAGRTFPCGDIEALVDALVSVLKNPPSQAAIAANASGYSLAAAADGITAALQATHGGAKRCLARS